MNRVWLIGLLLANGLLFGVMYWGGPLREAPPAPLTQAEFNADKIRLLDAAALRALADAATGSPSDGTFSSRASRLSGELTALPATARCLAWGEFSGENLARANDALANLPLGEKLQRRTVEYASGYWVFMPPQQNISQVKRKIEQLKQLGVNDYFVVQEEGEWLHAISLGVFRTEQAARNFLEVLKTKGVRTAQVGARQSKLKFTVFELRGISAAEEEKLRQLQHEFPDSEMKPTDCN